MRTIITYFADRSFIVNLISLSLIVFGLISATFLKRDLIPAYESKIVTIQADLIGASALDIEKFVTFPIEEAIKSIPAIDSIESTSKPNFARINIHVKYQESDMNTLIETIRARIDAIKDLNTDSAITINQQKTTSVQFLDVVVLNADPKKNEHRRWIDAISEGLSQIHGIVQVNSHLPNRDIYIHFDQKNIDRYGISVSHVRNKIYEYFQFLPVTEFKYNESHFAVKIEKELDNLDKIGLIPLKVLRSGKTIYVKDLAEIRYALKEVDTVDLQNGEPSLSIELHKDIGSDTIVLGEAVKKSLDEFNKKLPKPLSVEVSFDGTYFIKKQLSVLLNNGITGFFIVLLTLMLFVGFRLSIITALSVPIAYLGTLAAFFYLDISIDLISVVGLILILGILVDDSILVSEKYTCKLEEGLPPREAAIGAATELISPVTGTVLTTMIAFSPILFLKHEIANILYAIPVIIILALCISWFECFFILPNHLMHFAKTVKPSKFNLSAKLELIYSKVIKFLLKIRYLFLPLVAAFLGFTLYIAANKLKNNFNLSISRELVRVSVALKKSDSLEETSEKLAPLHKFLIDFTEKSHELSKIDTQIGSIVDGFQRKKGFRYANMHMFVDLKYDNPREIAQRIEKDINEKIATFKTDDFETLIAKKSLGDGSSKKDTVTVNISGGDSLSFEEVQEKIFQAIKDLDGIEKIYVDDNRYMNSWRFKINKIALEQYKIPLTDFTAQLKQAFGPKDLTTVRMKGEQVTIYTQIGHKNIPTYKDIHALEIIPASGIPIPIKTLGEWKEVKTLNSIEHKNLLRRFKIDVAFNAEKTKIEDIKKKIDVALGPLNLEYPSYNFTVEEADTQSKESKEWALKVLLMCISLILIVLAFTLGSITQTLIVGAAIPFGLVGVIWALYAHDIELGLMVMIGLVGMAGVAVNDSLIMVYNVNSRRKKGILDREDIILGSTERLKSIVMTTITTLGGVFPMAYGIGGESGFTQPLGFSIGWGLLTATSFILLCVPLMLQMREDIFVSLPRRVSSFIKSKS